jgi:hypothetical protein
VLADLSPQSLLELPQHSFAQAAATADNIIQQTRAQQIEVPGWELREAQALGNVSRRNLTACQLLAKTHAADAPERTFQAEWDFSHHKHFPAVMLKRRS